ncbi:MAG TPA: choice-of-anchor L domain-containing protein [Polyangiaceae bacterium]
MGRTAWAGLVAAACLLACGSSKSNEAFAPDGGGTGSSSGGGGGDSGTRDAGADVPTLVTCGHPDCDGDGYAVPADCNDGDPLINPEAFDFPGDNIDDDCDGKVDDPVLHCETVPSPAPGTPTDFARAADLCAQNSKTNAGTVFDPLVHAAWGQVSGLGPGQTLWTSQTKPEQIAIVSSFGGDMPRSGRTMFGLANGPWGAADPRASMPLDPTGFHINDGCAAIPLMGQDCASLTNGAAAGGVNVQDWAELALDVKIPSNVQTVDFDFSFFSSEFNQWWDSAANDAFFVLVTSKALQGQNVAKDASGLAVTINSAFFNLCPAPPGPAGLSMDKSAAIQACVGTAGDASQMIYGTLAGTGYDGAAVSANDTAIAQNGSEYIYGGGTGWLTAKFPVTRGETLQMRIVLMDTFDGLKDSALLFDALRWEKAMEMGGVGRPQPNQ